MLPFLTAFSLRDTTHTWTQSTSSETILNVLQPTRSPTPSHADTSSFGGTGTEVQAASVAVSPLSLSPGSRCPQCQSYPTPSMLPCTSRTPAQTSWRCLECNASDSSLLSNPSCTWQNEMMFFYSLLVPNCPILHVPTPCMGSLSHASSCLKVSACDLLTSTLTSLLSASDHVHLTSELLKNQNLPESTRS